jgi:hypothetical protein
MSEHFINQNLAVKIMGTLINIIDKYENKLNS